MVYDIAEPSGRRQRRVGHLVCTLTPVARRASAGALACGNMTRFPLIAMATAALLAAGCEHPTVEERIAALPLPIASFKTDPYIQVAADLQALGRDAGCAALLRAATNTSASGSYALSPIFVLHRMLFTNTTSGDFRAPLIGGFTFVGDSTDSDWPLRPIALVDGIPFVVARRFFLSGTPEPPEAYLRYCLSECTWSSTKFSPRNKHQKNTALAKLIASKNWQTPLDQWERDYLKAQLR
jgi:hypothetical protein